ncbi:MAG: 50S ribosomal protein L15e [Candidatus Thorarchaeota archaeon]
MYKYVRKFWNETDAEEYRSLRFHRMIQWRREPSITRLERPTRLDRARNLGYKAKQGFVVVRARVPRGSRRKSRPKRGRRSKRMGVTRVTPGKSRQWIAEERVARKYPNMEILNSYWVGQDGMHLWYEIILIDPHHPVIQSDPKYQWLKLPSNRRRTFRGLTSIGKRGRGLRHKGKGVEQHRPSLRAHRRHGK